LYYATVVNRNYTRSERADPVLDFQGTMVGLIRSLGLHKPDTTPCGQPLSVGEAHAMFEIGREPGLTQNGLAQRLNLDKSTVSRLVGMLERRAWVERIRDRNDSRFYHLRLTAAGTKANAKLAQSRRAKFQRIFEAIPRAQRSAVAASLSALMEAIDES
jgi:DNA-binding MarR family transcriptional regulator